MDYLAMSSYNQKFLSEPDDAHICLICLEVAEEPWQHGECGRLYCKKCIFKYGNGKDCPNCKMTHPQYFPDNKSKREIQALPVRCDNAERGCNWKGTLGSIQKHLNVCQYDLLPCPNKCKDFRSKVSLLMRKNMARHQSEECPNREYCCPYCGEENTYAIITQVHEYKCPRKIVPCTNVGCLYTMERQYSYRHVEFECVDTIVACRYSSIGCEVKLRRIDMAVHELDEKHHLRMAIDTITEMKERMKAGEAPTFRCTDFQARKLSDAGFTSPAFYTSQGYHMAFKVDANGTEVENDSHISVYAPILQGIYDFKLDWPFQGSITFTLLNQREDKNHYSKTTVLTNEKNVTVGSAWGFPNFISHSALHYDPIQNTQYLKNDTLYFRVNVEVENYKPWLEHTADI